jgi:hypothetical protein
MNQITIEQYKAAIDKDRNTVYDRTLAFTMATVTVDTNGNDVYFHDNSTLSYYHTDGPTLLRLGTALNELATLGVHIREGFVDRSLNTEVYSRIDKFRFTYQHLEFSWIEMSQLTFLITKMRLSNNSFI